MPQPHHAELEVAIQAVTWASQICRNVQHSISADALEKNDRSPVTIADFASQAIVCRTLREQFPNDPIVAEEDAESLRGETLFLDRVTDELGELGTPVSPDDACRWIDWGNHDGTESRFWTLDPIDGTKGFLRKEQYAVALALIVGGNIEVAALACPNLSARDSWDNACGVVYSAIRGQGTQLSPLDLPDVTPHTVRVSSTNQPEMARMCESVESGHSAHDQSSRVCDILGISTDPVRLDSQAKYGVVARGEADMYLRLPTRPGYEEKIWDHAAGVLVVEESGGRVSDVHGKPLDFSLGTTLRQNHGVVVTNGLLHDEVIRALGELEI